MAATSLLTAVLPAAAQTSLNLGQYALQGSFGMPVAATETSAITYNSDRDSFVVVDDEGFDVVEVNRLGQQIGRITISGHPVFGSVNTQDTESITYLGNNRYMLGLERIRNGFVFETTFPAVVETINLTTDADRIQLFGPTDNVGNSGLEGLSFNPINNEFFGVKEKSALEIYRFTYDPVTFVPTVTQPFTPAQIAALGVSDFSDVQSLGAVPAFAGTALADNLLILSHESRVLIELDGNGTELSRLNLSAFAATNGWNAEGVTIDHSGNLFIVAEDNAEAVPGTMFVFAAVPEPSLAFLVLVPLVLVVLQRHRKRQSA